MAIRAAVVSLRLGKNKPVFRKSGYSASSVRGWGPTTPGYEVEQSGPDTVLVRHELGDWSR